MKKLILIIPMLLLTALLNATIYYCSTTGTDGAYPTRGTFANPWRSWHYAFNNVTPSDTVYFRGGVYTPYLATVAASIATTAIDGTRDNPTCFFAYPDDWAAGNYPIMDCQTMMTSIENQAIKISRASNLYFKGLHLRNVRQTQPGVANGSGWLVWSEYENDAYLANNLKFENCVAYNIGGSGFDFAEFDTVYVINCDAWNCVDTLNSADGINPYDPGGHGNGFAVSPRPNVQGNAEYSYISFYGCRAWSCSDQGWGMAYEGRVVFDHCWALNNGNNPFSIVYNGITFTNPGVKGSGIKLWYDASMNLKNPSVVQVQINNCILAYNAHIGLNWCDIGHPEEPQYRCHIYNNFIYASTYQIPYSGTTFGYNVADQYSTDTVGIWDHKYYNNLSYINLLGREDITTGIVTASNNLWSVSGTPVTNAYFASLDTAGMMGVRTRQSDGSLPDTDFGKPAIGSPLIDAGIDVFDVSFYGDAPDIGWFESGEDVPVDTGLITHNGYYIYSHGYLVSRNLPATGTILPEETNQIIADHTVVDRYDDIPDNWIDSVKTMLFVVGGESHNNAMTDYSMVAMENLDAKFNSNIRGLAQAHQLPTDAYLRVSRNTWQAMDALSQWWYYYGEEDWFTSPEAIALTKTGIAYCNTNGYPMDAFGFGWCWDPLIDSPSEFSLYLDATDQYNDYCVTNDIPTVVFYSTGTVDNDDGSATNETDYNKYLGYEQIRTFVEADPTRVLFDYADILVYDDNGTYSTTPYTGTWNGHTFPMITPTNGSPVVAGHISAAGHLRIGKALWWMLARMAGWDGN